MRGTNPLAFTCVPFFHLFTCVPFFHLLRDRIGCHAFFAWRFALVCSGCALCHRQFTAQLDRHDSAIDCGCGGRRRGQQLNYHWLGYRVRLQAVSDLGAMHAATLGIGWSDLPKRATTSHRRSIIAGQRFSFSTAFPLTHSSFRRVRLLDV